MPVTFGFYNSVGGDRTYNATQFSRLFDGIITDGVFEEIGQALVVKEGVGMQVLVGDGKAWFDHTWTLNDADLALAVVTSDLVNPRFDTVILEVNSSDAVRANTIKILTGTPAASPVPPTLTNTAEIHQHPLAYISVAAGVSSILAANIEDLRGTANCPWVTIPQSAPGSGGAAVLETQVFS